MFKALNAHKIGYKLMTIKLRLYVISLFVLCCSSPSYAEAIGADYGAAIGSAIAIALAVILGIIIIIVMVVKKIRKSKK